MANPPEPASVHGIILAAGQSKRLGRPKQLLDICGESVIRRVAKTALRAQLASVLVVTGNAGDQIERELEPLDVQIVPNPDFATGQASSLRAGLKALPPTTDAAMFLLGDQPGISSSVIDALITTYERARPTIVQARYRGQPGHPVLFNRSLVAELSEVSGDQGARDVIRRHIADVAYVELDLEVPLDIDTEADYQAVLRHFPERQAK